MSDLTQTISTETVLQLLVKQQRRQILRRVADTPDGTSVDRLKKHLGRERTANPDGSGVDSRFIELHHVHLPKLQDANVIVHDAASGIVQRGEHFQTVVSLLQVIDGYRDDASTRIA